MRTESDLMAAFRALERRADDYGTPSFRVMATGDARPPRARLAVSMLAAAAVVAGAVGIALAVAGHRPPSSEPPADHRSVVSTSPAPTGVSTVVPAPRSFDPRRLSFSLDRINGVDLVQVRAFRQVQEVMLRSGAGDRWDVMLNAPGSWGPFATTGSPKVTVAGRPAFYGPTPDALPFAVGAERPVVLTWEYTPGAWGVVVSEDTAPIPLDVARMVAESVHPGVLTSVALPLRIRQAPPGMTVQGYVAETGVHGHGETARAVTTVDFTRTGATTDLTVDLSQRVAGEPVTGRPVTIDGRPAYLGDGTVTALVGGNYVLRLTEAPQPGGGRTLGDEQLLALARGIDLPTDVTDPTTWFDSATALP